jgi:hypothetical protein
MSEEVASTTKVVTVYVRLLDEGTEVFRPSTAVPLGENVYQLLRPEFYDPEDEHWEFEPGARVHVTQHQGIPDEYLVAASLAE